MKTIRSVVIDILALLLYIIAANPAITGLGIHEWVSLGVLAIFIVHGIQHYDWVLETLKALSKHPSLTQIANLVLGILLVVVFMVVTVSGIMVSRHILPLFGLVAPGYFFWNPLHSLSAKMLLALVVIHIVIHAGWFWAHIKNWNQSRKQRKAQGWEGDI